MDELVSVVIPVYNVEKYLDRCLESVCGQTYRKIEIILINDGSTDHSAEICNRWKQKDDRIIYFENKNQGLGPTRNYGIKKATGKYIAFIDSDDWWELDAIEKLYRSASTYGSDMVYMNFYWEGLTEDGQYRSRVFCQYDKFDGVVDSYDCPGLIFSNDARTWSKFYKTGLFKENNIEFPAHPYEDFPVNPILVMTAKKISQVYEPLYHYDYGRPQNLSGSSKNFKWIPYGLSELKDSLMQRGFWDRCEERYKDYAFKLCRNTLNDTRLADKEVRNKYIDFLMENANEYMALYEKKFVFYGTFAGYQIVVKNMFASQIMAMYIDDLPEKAIEVNDLKKDIDYHADYIMVDVLKAFKEDCVANIRRYFDRITEFLEIQSGRIILPKYHYARTYGIEKKSSMFFDCLGQINTANRALDECYKELEERFLDRVISVSFEDEENYTYVHTPFGCLPQFYNGRFYESAFQSIEGKIKQYE